MEKHESTLSFKVGFKEYSPIVEPFCIHSNLTHFNFVPTIADYIQHDLTTFPSCQLQVTASPYLISSKPNLSKIHSKPQKFIFFNKD